MGNSINKSFIYDAFQNAFSWVLDFAHILGKSYGHKIAFNNQPYAKRLLVNITLFFAFLTGAEV